MRMIRQAILVFAIVAMPVSPMFAQTGPANPAPSTAPEKTIIVEGHKEKKVCKMFEAPTGSRVGARRICRTMAEWRLAEDTTQRIMDRENRRYDANRALLENEKGKLGSALPH